MRRLVALFAIVAIVGLVVGGHAAPLGAGGDASLTVQKVVTGPVPPGTTFTVDLNCGTEPNEGTTAITFDEEGSPQPPGSNVVTWGPVLGEAFECTPTEQQPEGATVSYSCTATVFNECGQAGPQAEPIVVEINGTGSVEVTVSNSFAEPAPESGPEPAPAPAPAIDARPTFTG